MRNIMRVMGSMGDTTIEWDPELHSETMVAELQFNRYKEAGCTIFSVDPETKDTQLVDHFFAQTRQLVVVRPIAGG